MENSRELIRILQERKSYLEDLLQNVNSQNEKLEDVPTSKVRVLKRGKGYQYYLRTDGKDTSGKYLKKEQEFQAQQILQKEYLQKAGLMLQRELALLSQYLEKASPIQLMTYYESLNEGRQVMIEPLEVSDDVYEENWMNMPYDGKVFLPNTPEFYTQKMERVRSKSEIIIADALEKFHIPYRYECPIVVKGMGKIYPDFTVLNVRKRKELYWEHFGLIDDEEYREKAMRKIAIYEENHIYVGDKLIVTYESARQPLNMKDLERKIKKFLM